MNILYIIIDSGWENSKEREIKLLLWGYPALVRRFFEDVRPLMVEARENAQNRKKYVEMVHLPKTHREGIFNEVNTVGPDRQSHPENHSSEDPAEKESMSPTTDSTTGSGYLEGLVTRAEGQSGVLNVTNDTKGSPQSEGDSGEVQ